MSENRHLDLAKKAINSVNQKLTQPLPIQTIAMIALGNAVIACAEELQGLRDLLETEVEEASR